MNVYVGCGRDVAVTEKFLNRFDRHFLGMQESGASVAQIMKSYSSKAVFFQELGESAFDVIRLDYISERIGKNVVQIRFIVRVSAEFSVFLLYLAPVKQPLSYSACKRKRAEA